MVCQWSINGLSLFCKWSVNVLSMICKWSVNGQSIVCQWSINGQSMVCQWSVWSVNGLSMISQLSVNDLSMVCQWSVNGRQWSVNGLSMVCQWYVNDLSMVCLWSVNGLSMVCQWSVNGVLVIFTAPQCPDYCDNIDRLLISLTIDHCHWWKSSSMIHQWSSTVITLTTFGLGGYVTHDEYNVVTVVCSINGWMGVVTCLYWCLYLYIGSNLANKYLHWPEPCQQMMKAQSWYD